MQEDIEVTNKDQCGGCLTWTSKFSKHSPESHVEWTVKESNTQGQVRPKVQDIFNTQEACEGDSSESSRESSKFVELPELNFFVFCVVFQLLELILF